MLILPYPPSANRYWRHAKGRTYLSDDALLYRKAVGWQCEAMQMAPHAGPVALTLRYYRPAKRGDLDNRLKQLLDSLNGHLYNDDAQVVEIHAYQGDDKRNPRVEIEWEPR
jgi:crossover junction endodeoxyribonuclease RusA